MAKKDLKITIEESILEKGKKTIPNLSKFFEECLKHYLGLLNGMYPIVNDQDILESIGKLQVRLYINKCKFDLEERIKIAENMEKDKVWRFLWNDYQIRLIPDKNLLENAVSKLEVDEETLDEILDWTYETAIDVDTNIWQNVFETYKENNF